MKPSLLLVPVSVILVMRSSTTGSQQAPKPMTTGSSTRLQEVMAMQKRCAAMQQNTSFISTKAIWTAVISVCLFYLLVGAAIWSLAT
jgi:hypothetical protein